MVDAGGNWALFFPNDGAHPNSSNTLTFALDLVSNTYFWLISKTKTTVDITKNETQNH